MPGLRSVTEYRTPKGKRRRVRLYQAWRNIHTRVQGHTTTGNSQERLWLGLEVGFRDWQHFREWSLRNGYSRERCSLDRNERMFGYTPGNCEWVTVSENSRRSYATMITAIQAREGEPCPF